MDKLASLDSSRDLQSICAKIFVNRLHLVLQIGKILLQKIFLQKENTAIIYDACLFPRKPQREEQDLFSREMVTLDDS